MCRSRRLGLGARAAAIVCLAGPLLGGCAAHSSFFVVLRMTDVGGLDPSFGTQGVVLIPRRPPGTSEDRVSIAIDRQRRVIGSGTDGPDAAAFVYSQAGRPDARFGIGGVARASAPDAVTLANTGVAVHSSKGVVSPGFVAVGYAERVAPAGSAFTLISYDDTGVDHGFAPAGVLLIDFPNFTSEQGTAIAFDGVGRIVAAGCSIGGVPASGLLLARYAPDGQPDPTFGHNGLVTAAPGDSRTTTRDLVIDDLGRILAVGAAPGGVALDARLTDGTVDVTFGIGGTAVTAFPRAPDARAEAMALTRDQKLVVAGNTGQSPDGTFLFVARFNRDGSADATFGDAGATITDVPTSTIEEHWAVTVDGAGRTLAAGDASVGGRKVVIVARYTVDGRLDSTFGSDGVAFPVVAARDSVATSVVADPAGGIIVGGTAYQP